MGRGFAWGGLCYRNKTICTPAPGLAGAPALHARATQTVCDDCWEYADNELTDVENARLQTLIASRPAAGQAVVLNMNGLTSQLCKFCEADELEQYLRNAVLLVPPPANAEDGWEDSCICIKPRTRLQYNTLGATASLYCVGCRQAAMNTAAAEGASDVAELQSLARNQAGNHVTASPALIAWRNNNTCPIACRCGRRPTRPTVKPKVTYCLVCSGTQIDKAQVTKTRHTDARIQGGALPALRWTSASFNLTSRPPISRNAGVTTNTNNNGK